MKMSGNSDPASGKASRSGVGGGKLQLSSEMEETIKRIQVTLKTLNLILQYSEDTVYHSLRFTKNKIQSVTSFTTVNIFISQESKNVVGVVVVNSDNFPVMTTLDSTLTVQVSA